MVLPGRAFARQNKYLVCELSVLSVPTCASTDIRGITSLLKDRLVGVDNRTDLGTTRSTGLPLLCYDAVMNRIVYSFVILTMTIWACGPKHVASPEVPALSSVKTTDQAATKAAMLEELASLVGQLPSPSTKGNLQSELVLRWLEIGETQRCIAVISEGSASTGLRWLNLAKLVHALFDGGMQQEAIRVLDGLEQSSLTTHTLHSLGLTLASVGQFERARQIADTLHPGGKVGLYRGRNNPAASAGDIREAVLEELIARGRIDEALGAMEEISRVGHTSFYMSEIENSVALMLIAKRKVDMALRVLNATREGLPALDREALAKEDSEFRRALVGEAIQRKDAEGAQLLNQGFSSKHFCDNQVQIAAIFAKAGQQEKARSAVEQALARMESDLSLRVLAGLVVAAADVGLLDALLDKNRRLWNDHRYDLKGIAGCITGREDLERSAQETIQGLRPRRQFRAYEQIIETCARLGKGKEIDGYIEGARTVADADDQDDLAGLYIALGRIDRALTLAKQSTKQKTKARIYSKIGSAAIKTGQSELLLLALTETVDIESRVVHLVHGMELLIPLYKNGQLTALLRDTAASLNEPQPPRTPKRRYEPSTDPSDYQTLHVANRALELRLTRSPDLDSDDILWLEHVVRYGTPYTRQFAAEAYGKHVPNQAIELFEELGMEQFAEAVFFTGRPGLSHVQQQISKDGVTLETLIILTDLVNLHYESPEAATATPILLAALTLDDKRYHLLAARSLSGPQFLDRVRQNTKHKSVDVRRGAMIALGNVEQPSAEVDVLLRGGLEDADATVRAAAKEGLAKRAGFPL